MSIKTHAYTLLIFFVYPDPMESEENQPSLINEKLIHFAPDEFIVYGNNIQVSFSPNTPGPAIAAIAQLDEGFFENGNWIPGRRLNGDDIMIDYDLAKKAKENKTGTGLKFQGENRNIQKVKLYRYE